MKDKKGQTLVETAIILPILLVLILGLIDFARAMYTKNTLNNAARCGARAAAVTPSLCAESGALQSPATPTAQTIRSNLFEGVPSSVTYSVNVLNAAGTGPITGTASPGNLVQVTVTWTDFPMITPFYRLAGLITNPAQGSGIMTLTGQAAMRYE